MAQDITLAEQEIKLYTGEVDRLKSNSEDMKLNQELKAHFKAQKKEIEEEITFLTKEKVALENSKDAEMLHFR